MIVSVMYKSKYTGLYSGREYIYESELPLKRGDTVLAPTRTGDAEAVVCRVDIPESEASFEIKEITAYNTEGDEL